MSYYTETDPITGETSTFGGIAESAAEYHARDEICPYDCARCEYRATHANPAPEAPAPDLATERQVSFLRQLATERVCGISPDAMAEAASRITKAEASKWITAALAKPRKVEAQAETVQAYVPDAEEVPAGRYAVDIDGRLGFFVIDRPEKGRWVGFVFVRQLSSDTEYPVRGERRNLVLAAVKASPRAAAIRYGRELGQCGVCGRTLTDEASRAAGIGPRCAEKRGW